MADDAIARPATPDEIAKALEDSLERIRAGGRDLFENVSTLDELASRLGSFLETLQGDVFAPAAQRLVLKPNEMLLWSLLFPACLAIVRTLENNPMLGTRALKEQLDHNFLHIVNRGRPTTAVIFEKSGANKS